MSLVLVDTSIWADHLAKADAVLESLVKERRVLCHPIVIGEISMGNLRNRELVLVMLRSLKVCQLASPRETHDLVEGRRFYGSGIQWNDAQLLASALKSGVAVWTRDRRMKELAGELGCAFVG